MISMSKGIKKNKTYGGKNEIQKRTGFHPYRAPRRDCDHRDSGRDAAPRFELGTRESTPYRLHQQPETDRPCREDVFRRLWRTVPDCGTK